MKLDLDRQGAGRTELAIDGSLEIGLPEGRPDRVALHGVLTVDNIESRFLVGGQLSATGRTECGRCLSDFELTWDVPVEITVLRDVHSEEGVDDSMVIHQKTGVVDLTRPLRESVILAFPLTVVCREDCKGLCAQCGADWNETTCECVSDDIDPRWEGLP